MYQSIDLRYLMRCIADSCPVPSVQPVASSYPQRHSAPSMERFEVVPLEQRALVAYLQERGIPAYIAKAKCKEAYYCVNGRFYFAVAFENVSGGCELRNRYFKGCRGRKDISISAVGEMVRQQSVPCSRGLLIISPLSHSA